MAADTPTERLNDTNEDLSDGARLTEVRLKLRCGNQRRLLNQAIFHGLYIEEDQIIDHKLKQPFAHLYSVQAGYRLVQSDKPEPGAPHHTAPERQQGHLPYGGRPCCYTTYRGVAPGH
jgi:hypothetical protein